MRFRTTIVQSGKTATGIEVPDEVMEALGSGKRPAVKVTLNGYSYRSTVATVGGRSMVGLSAEHRAGAGVTGGDEVGSTWSWTPRPGRWRYRTTLRQPSTPS